MVNCGLSRSETPSKCAYRKDYLFTEQVHEQQGGNLGHALAVANLAHYHKIIQFNLGS